MPPISMDTQVTISAAEQIATRARVLASNTGDNISRSKQELVSLNQKSTESAARLNQFLSELGSRLDIKV